MLDPDVSQTTHLIMYPQPPWRPRKARAKCIITAQAKRGVGLALPVIDEPGLFAEHSAKDARRPKHGWEVHNNALYNSGGAAGQLRAVWAGPGCSSALHRRLHAAHLLCRRSNRGALVLCGRDGGDEVRASALRLCKCPAEWPQAAPASCSCHKRWSCVEGLQLRHVQMRRPNGEVVWACSRGILMCWSTG